METMQSMSTVSLLPDMYMLLACQTRQYTKHVADSDTHACVYMIMSPVDTT